MSREVALGRTLLLSRQLMGKNGFSDEVMLRALANTTICIVADEPNLRSLAGQYAATTLAWLVLALGCGVRLLMPEVSLVGTQPPLRGVGVRAAILDLAAHLIPGGTAEVVDASRATDLVFILGDTDWRGSGALAWRLSAGDWWGSTSRANENVPRLSRDFPIGPGIAAAVAAIEPFKAAVRTALTEVGARPSVPELVQAVANAHFQLPGSSGTWAGADLGRVDWISGGAITNAALHVLFRVPDLSMDGRVIEDETLDLTNMNRYALATLDNVGLSKGSVLSGFSQKAITLVASPHRLEEATIKLLAPLAPTVLVGADSLPARWLAQAEHPSWLGVGSTGDFTILVSEHPAGWPCAGCLHPLDDSVVAVIPTASVVSYWAGLLLAARLVLRSRRESLKPARQALCLWPLRMDLPASRLWFQVLPNPGCPVDRAADLTTVR